MAQKAQPKATKVLTYKELISKSDSQIQSEELDLKVQESKSELEVTIATTKRDLAVAKRNLTNSQSRIPYNIKYEMENYQTVTELEAGLAFAERVLAERF